MMPSSGVLGAQSPDPQSARREDMESVEDSHLLEVRNVYRRFGNATALDGVSMTIYPNEFFVLLGPSGCGKTTLLRAIAGFETIDEGAILLSGNDLLTVAPNKRPVNLMFQSYALFPHMTVAKNIAYGLERERVPRAELDRRVGAVLEAMHIEPLAQRRPAQLSGGEKQRVALARAIVKRPQLLLLDEPLSALDRKVRIEMQAELKRLQHEVGITFVMVTHDQQEAMSMADRIAVMASGRVQQLDSPIALYRNPANLFVADFVGSSNLLAGRVAGCDFHSDDFGLVPMSANPNGVTGGHLVIRPEDVRVLPSSDSGVPAVVTDIQFHGAASTVILAPTAPGAQLMLAMVTGIAPFQPGDPVSLSWQSAIAVEDSME